jgi:hypothetical protein
MSKPFSQCSLFDLAHAIFEHARAASACALDSATADRLLPALRNAALTKAVLSRHPLVRDHSGLKCDGSAHSKRAWCGMLRDLVTAAGVDVSDAALLRVYLVCKECAKRGRVQLPLTFKYHDHFLGKVVRILVVQHLQIAAPLMLVKAALRFARSRAAPGTALHQPPMASPSVGCTQVALFAAHRVRFMFGFTAKVCDRASNVDACAIEYFRTAVRWRTCIMEHVMAGYVSKVQVCLLLWKARAACCVDV